MFTGIIESLGRVIAVDKTRTGLRLEIKFDNPVRGLKLGESIAVDGVCLTAAEVSPNGFAADVVKETLKSTTMALFRLGQPVHLERALKLGSRMGGHTISGHVDGRGTVTRVSVSGRSKIIGLKVPASALKFCLAKASIAVNGVSLTIQEVSKKEIKIALVPHTLQETLLKNLKKNSRVNVEADVLLRKPDRGHSIAPQKLETPGSIHRRLGFLTRQGF